MSDVRCKNHEYMETAYQIMQSLDTMFIALSNKTCLDAVSAFTNVKMKNGSSIHDHVLNMIVYLHEAEINSTIIVKATQLGIILESPSPQFKQCKQFQQFKNNYDMNKMSWNVTELLNEWQNFESTNNNRKARKTNVVVAKSY